MMDIGRVCMKIAGRDAAMQCVIVDVIDKNYVMVDGQTRRKRCNICHLEPLNNVLKIKKNASHDVVVKAFKEIGIEISESKKKEKIKSVKPVKVRKTKLVTENKK